MLYDLKTQFPDLAFVMVYIREAHASDEWPLGTVCSRPQHKTIEDRLAAAREFATNCAFDTIMVVDSISNEFNNVFAAWPERYFCVHNSKLAHVAVPAGEFGFDRDMFKLWLKDFSAVTVTEP